MILTGAELRMANGYVLALDDPATTPELLGKKASLRPEWLDSPTVRPSLVLPIPVSDEQVESMVQAGRGMVVGLELYDGDPRGIEQSFRERADLLRLAARLDLALVSGTNLHGWGRTATAWTLLRIRGWRAMSPDQLAAAIEVALRTRTAGAARVIERVVTDPGGSTVARVFTLPLVALHFILALRPAERISWLVWMWVGALVLRARMVSPRGAS